MADVSKSIALVLSGDEPPGLRAKRPQIDIWGDVASNIPTAVNFPLTWKIMITVITSATICMALAAIWKIIVFAISIFRA